MKKNNYCIKESYTSRRHEKFFNDIGFEDRYQNEVYMLALDYFNKHGLKTILDIGCGSGFKLMKYFNNFKTIGVDLAHTIDKLNSLYPGQDWRISDFSKPFIEPVDLVISADVIEHILDPDVMMNYIREIEWKYLILSTPDRSMLKGGHSGPPMNPCHVREWSFEEFKKYVGGFFHVVDHIITNKKQSTQCIVCVPKED